MTARKKEKLNSKNEAVAVIFHNVFVTVGTTSFDSLVELIMQPETLVQLNKWKTNEVRVQIGDCKLRNEGTSILNGIKFTYYRYKSSLAEDINWADLVICHAGAGTTLDVMDSQKIICVIPNDSLMNNHQNELANCIVNKGFGFSTTIEKFPEYAPKISTSVLPFPQSNIQRFMTILETEIMDFDPILTQALKDKDKE